MTVENRELINRATGIVEGVALIVDKNVSDALFTAISILQDLLDKEDNENA